MSKKIDELLTKSGVAINNGINQAAIASLLQEFGYTPERLAEGQDLRTTAGLLTNRQKKEDGEQQAATEALNQSIEEANRVYIPFLKIARVAFRKDTNRYIQLELNGSRKDSHSDWLGQTKVFYANLLADEEALEKMAGYGQTQEKLETGLGLVIIAEEKLAMRKKEMGEAQDATIARDEAVDALQEWYSDYIEIARLALADQPQYLEMLGIISPS
ncbi:hypothetical protein OU798_14580 [Prolixibacteraceae bacterium Z1-6]|uniref:Uncharacterized protein n=1 Tax=Draconibacterium aestuarii TaxID=2998507 RepID=A0A9X3F6P8_9BACT|nr:hypothetical protein [Prolixibacteraceae bacterium Z1-6]